MGYFGVSLRPILANMCQLRPIWASLGHLGVNLGHLGAILRPTWGTLGAQVGLMLDLCWPKIRFKKHFERILFLNLDFHTEFALPSTPLNPKNGGFSLEGFQKTRFAGISQKLFQEWLLDPILGGFWAQVGVPKSPKTGSKTPKNHVQDNIITNNIFNKK